MSTAGSGGGGFRVESLGQLYTRIQATDRTDLRGFCAPLFGKDAPQAQQTIEITGDTNAGKTHLLMELMACALLHQHPLPAAAGDDDEGAAEGSSASDADGNHNGVEVIFIDTEHQFQIFKLSAILEKHIRRLNEQTRRTVAVPEHQEEAETQQLRRTIDMCLRRVHILGCHSTEQLDLAIYDLERRFRESAGRIGLLALDSVSTFYWQECPPDVRPIRMDTHVHRMVGKLAVVSRKYEAVLAYVRTQSFRTKKTEAQRQQQGPSNSEKTPHFVVMLEKRVGGEFVATLHKNTNPEPQRRASYTIDCFGINWTPIEQDVNK